MKEITRFMIEHYNMKGIDFMGYYFNTKNASYHHMIIPARHGGGLTVKNGAILNGMSSHPYIHVIENKDFEIYERITKEMIEENLSGKIDIVNLKRIRDLLLYFEKEHKRDTTSKHKILIKQQFKDRVDL